MKEKLQIEGNPSSLVQHLGIEMRGFEGDFFVGTMPVDHRTQQPFGILHGGATVALAESLGSYGSYLLIDKDKYIPVGMEVNCNHLKSVRSGTVTGKAKIVHKGKKVHVWHIDVLNEQKELVATSRLTVMIIEKK